MLRKISSSIIAFILSVGLFGNPILAEEQLPNVESIEEQTPHIIKEGPGKPNLEPIEYHPATPSDPVEPNTTIPTPEPINEPDIIEPKNLEVVPTSSTIIINGESVSFEAYLINGNNYFKLRDLAYVLSEEKTAEVIETKTPSNMETIKDVAVVQFTAYLVNGDIYFKLRDLGAAFDFGVDWDGENNTVVIDTNKSYTIN